MPIFTYKAKDTKGETIQGSMEADTQAIVINRLQSMGFFPLMVQADLSAKKKTSGLNRIFRARIKNTDLTSFNRQLSDLLSAGIPLVKALTIIVNQTANESLREIVATVSHDVQGGDTLAAALLQRELLQRGSLAKAIRGNNQQIGVFRRHFRRDDLIADIEADTAHTCGWASHRAYVIL